jgi:hypothetical protein
MFNSKVKYLNYSFSNQFNGFQDIFSSIKTIVFICLVVFSVSFFANQTVSNINSTKSGNLEPNSNDTVDSNQYSADQRLDDRLQLIQKADQNHNLIADRLEEKMSNSDLSGSLNVFGILNTNQPVPKELISLFKSLNGMITFQWDSLGMFAGKIPENALKSFSELSLQNKYNLGLIEEDRQMVKYAEPHKLTNVQPYVWQNYNLLGDKNNSIAIFDTGIDETHPMLANYSTTPDFTNDSIKLIGWHDGTSDGATDPEDFDGHGSHVAGIAAGNSFNDTNSNGYINTTYTASYKDSQALGGTYGYSTYLNITRPGDITQTYYWKRSNGATSTSGAGMYLYNPSGSVIASDLSNTPIDTNSGNYSISHTVVSNFGLYKLTLWFDYGDPNSNLDMIAYGSYPYSNELSTLNATFSGVSPLTKIVGVKVFDNAGSGLSSYLVNGINWVITNKITYHITVASMSLGFPCSSSGCVPGDKVSSVETAVNDLVNAGIVVFVAAGNDGDLANNQIGSPGNIDSVITVGATDNYHNRTDYSSEGPGLSSTSMKPDLTAPGGSNSQGAILSADTNDNEVEGTANGIIPDFQKNDLIALQGTSMATPHAAGIGTLMVQALGGYGAWNYSSADVKKIKQYMLMSTWSNYGTDRATKDKFEGWGEIQADTAIDVIMKEKYMISSSISGQLSDERFSNKIWGRQVILSAGTQYNFILNLSVSLDADLYLYSKDYDSSGNPILLKVAKTDGNGISEFLSYTVSSSGNYFIFIKTWSGNGSFTLTSTSAVSTTTITINNPLSDASLSGMVLVQVTATSGTGIHLAQVRFSGSYLWANLTYNTISTKYEFTLDTKQFLNGSYHGLDVKIVSNNGVITYRSVYYSISTTFTDPDTISIALQGVIENQLNNIYSTQFIVNFTVSTIPDNSSIYVNHALYAVITNNSLELILQDGSYDIRVVAIKGSTIRSIATTFIEINTGPKAPQIIAPSTFLHEIGVDESISWFVTDLNPDNYTIFRNGINIANGSWISQVSISISLINLSLGVYNFTLFVFDNSGLNSTSTVIVQVFVKPVISSPDDLIFKEGIDTQSIIWNVTDNNLANYTIFKDNIEVEFGILSGTSATIQYNLTGLTIGTFEFMLQVKDDEFGLAEDIVIVTVSPKTDPISSNSQTNTITTITQPTSSNQSKTNTNSLNINAVGFEFLMVSILFVSMTLSRKLRRKN